MDTEEENQPEYINQEEIPQPVIRSTRHTTQINRLETTMRVQMYQNNHLITQTVEAN